MTRSPSNPQLRIGWLYALPTENTFHSRAKSGKWCLSVAPDAVDVAWSRIEELVLARQLRAAMVSTLWGRQQQGFDTHVICVFTEDYEDKDEIRRVRKLLLDEGFLASMGYKRDVDTLNPIPGQPEFIFSDADMLG